MKMKGAKQVHYDSGPNMTPLVDVVMVILIFLMLAGSFGASAHYLISKQGLKKSGGHGRPLKPGEVPDENLDIRIDNNRSGPGFVAEGTGIPRTNDPDKLEAELAGKLQSFKAAGTGIDHIQVVLYPTKAVKYDYLIQIYQAALRAKYEKVAFATSQ